MDTAKKLAEKFVPQKGLNASNSFASASSTAIEIAIETCFYYRRFLDKIVETDVGRLQVLMDGLPALLRPIIRSLFVGKSLFNTLLHFLFSSFQNVLLSV